MKRYRLNIKYKLGALIFLTGHLLMSGCEGRKADIAKPTDAFPLVELMLPGELSESESEISGLCWYKDQLLLLPQYPDRYRQNNKSVLFRLAKKDIIDYLDRKGSGLLPPQKIEFDDQAATAQIPGFQGYEAIVCIDDRIFLTIESNQSGTMRSYLVQGQVAEDYSKIVLDPDKIIGLDLPRQIRNMSFETLLAADEKLIAIYELNGANVNAGPYAVQIDPKTGLRHTLDFPTIEYRVTDATAIDEKGNFWVLNYYWPGEYNLTLPAEDLLLADGGKVQIFEKEKAVERLLQLHYTADRIEFTGTSPIYLGSANNAKGRNWEGVTRLDGRGFLIATDKHPRTILAFVAVDSMLTKMNDY